MSIEKYMDASTCYITEKDSKLLLTFDFPFVVYEYESGYFVHTFHHSETLEKLGRAYGLSEDFIALLLFAHDKDCTFIKLDCDGDDSYNFTKHNW